MKHSKSKFITSISSILLAISTIPLSSCIFIKEEDSVKEYKRNYRFNEIRVAEQNTFRKINNVTFPNPNYPTQSKVSDLEKEAYANFSNKTYHALVNTSKPDNFSYATVGLYSLMNELVGASSRSDLTADLNELLGLNEANRQVFYEKIMKANSFASEESTTQLKNAAFFNNSFKYNPAYVDILTSLYCQAFELSFKNDAEKMVEWVNQAVNSDGFIDTKFLELTEDTELYLFSTLYFKNMWANKYLAEENVEDDFHLTNGSTVKANYMRHSYMTEGYYDYGDYISVTDYYSRGTASITYLIPKKVEDNIFELTKDANIFYEDETKLVKDDSEFGNWYTVNLKTPKFTLKANLNFKDSLTSLGFGSMFSDQIDSFHNAFNDEKLDEFNLYVSVMKQRNEVEFNEDGSLVKSVSMAAISKAESAMPMNGDTLDVDLNQPFIYIIRDINDTPIFVGHVDNPVV